MIDDRIRQIAEEYIDLIDFDDFYTEEEITRLEVKRFLKFLSERYCVVERSKVVELYKDCEYLMDVYPSMTNGLANKLTTLEQLFGSETFNKKEDD